MTTAHPVSVALCTHNGERFIGEQLASILDQSQPPTEIVLSDDASSDETVPRARAVIARFRAERPDSAVQLRIIENPVALGVARNFEQALLACTNELIALSDQDDIWLPSRVERAVAVFDLRPDLLLLHSDAFLVDESGRRLDATLFRALEVSTSTQDAIHVGAAFEQLMKRNLVTGATTMIRRRLLDSATPFPAEWVHDEWLAIVAAAVGEIDVLPEPLVSYRQHASNHIGARRLSVLGKFGRLMEPGTGRNRRLLDRATVLADRLPLLGNGVSEARRAAARRKVVHERMRRGLPANRMLRIMPVLRELGTGRYSEFGRGALDAARDLLQPLEVDR
ncbi:glycosyltransferase family 2 protein [Parafrigoribacterium soli]|uniref:glycosyltransferase family 2 protein n=1 Tax=Parafrigoribacterium soli TaxID=3144663 RepID=UPI0032ED53A0